MRRLLILPLKRCLRSLLENTSVARSRYWKLCLRWWKMICSTLIRSNMYRLSCLKSRALNLTLLITTSCLRHLSTPCLQGTRYQLLCMRLWPLSWSRHVRRSLNIRRQVCFLKVKVNSLILMPRKNLSKPCWAKQLISSTSCHRWLDLPIRLHLINYRAAFTVRLIGSSERPSSSAT